MNIDQEKYNFFNKLLSSVIDNDVLVVCYYPSDVRIRLRDVCEILDELGIPYKARKSDNSISIRGHKGEHKIRFVSRNNEKSLIGFIGDVLYVGF